MEDDIELEDESGQKHYNNHPWRKIFKTVFKRKKYAIGLIISVAVLALLDTLFPFINKYALEHYFGPTPSFDNLNIFIILYISVACMYGITVFSYLFCRKSRGIYFIRIKKGSIFKFTKASILIF